MAEYGGNANLVPVVANGQVFVASNKQLQIFGLTGISKVATTTTLSSSINPSASGKLVAFSATVSPQSGSSVPTGKVSFQNGSTVLATKTLSNGTAKYSTSNLTLGSNAITAVYGGATDLSGSTSAQLNQFVQAVTTTAVTSSPNPSTFGQAVTFYATVSSSIGAPPGWRNGLVLKRRSSTGDGDIGRRLGQFHDFDAKGGRQLRDRGIRR